MKRTSKKHTKNAPSAIKWPAEWDAKAGWPTELELTERGVQFPEGTTLESLSHELGKPRS